MVFLRPSNHHLSCKETRGLLLEEHRKLGRSLGLEDAQRLKRNSQRSEETAEMESGTIEKFTAAGVESGTIEKSTTGGVKSATIKEVLVLS